MKDSLIQKAAREIVGTFLGSPVAVSPMFAKVKEILTRHFGERDRSPETVPVPRLFSPHAPPDGTKWEHPRCEDCWCTIQETHTHDETPKLGEQRVELATCAQRVHNMAETTICGLMESDVRHNDQTNPFYHPFVAPQTSSSPDVTKIESSDLLPCPFDGLAPRAYEPPLADAGELRVVCTRRGCPASYGGVFPSEWNERRATATPRVEEPIGEIAREVVRARRKFPMWPTDPLHALAVLGEEFGELTKAIVQYIYEPQKSSARDVREEAVQTAAMAQRFLDSMQLYDFKRCQQHEQTGRSAEARVEEKQTEEER